MKPKLARVSVITSMVIFGTIAIFVRNIPLPSGELALYRALMACLLIAPVLVFSKRKITSLRNGKYIPFLLLSGAALGFNWILLFEAYRYTTVSLATLSYYFAPVLVAIFSPIFFKEKPTAKQLICFLCSTVGLVLIIGVQPDTNNGTDAVGILYGLGAACLYASVVLLNKYVADVDGLLRTFLQFVAASIVLLPYVALTSGFTIGTLPLNGWISLLIVGIVHTGIAYCLYFGAVKNLSGQETALLSYIDPVIAVLISIVILQEALTPIQAIGGIIILGFTIWNELSAKKVRA